MARYIQAKEVDVSQKWKEAVEEAGKSGVPIMMAVEAFGPEEADDFYRSMAYASQMGVEVILVPNEVMKEANE